MTSDDDRTSYEYMESLIFGMDPGDWAAILHQKLSAASAHLRAARAFQADEAKDFTETTEADALADVRLKAALVVAELYQTLAAMPIMQIAPGALDGLHYILTSLGDVERGAAPAWLVAKPTKAHPTRLAAQVEWVSIVTCVQLLRLLPDFEKEDVAVKEVVRLSKRPNGTIKGWCRKLYCPTRHEVPAARAQIETELISARAAIKFMPEENHPAFINRRIHELLPQTR